MTGFELYLRSECGSANGTVKVYLSTLKLINAQLAEQCTGADLDRASVADVQAALRVLAAEGRASATLCRYLSIIATYWRFVGRSADVNALERPRREQPIPNIPNRAEIVALIESAANLRDRAILELLYATGLRSEELCQLRVGDLTPDHVLVHGKGGKDRTVPVGDAARGAIAAYLFTRGDVRATDWMFPGEGGEALAYSALAWLVGKYARASHQRCHVTPHTFRHCFATHMLIEGRCNPVDIMGMLGHENLDTTARYMHMQIGHLKREHERCHPSERRARGESPKTPPYRQAI